MQLQTQPGWDVVGDHPLRKLLRIEQAEHERFDDFALEHTSAIAEEPEPVDRPGVR